MPSGGNTKERIIEISRGLLQTRGYSGFSYADISKELGIRKASIHHHFPTKEDLGLALLDAYHTESMTAIQMAGELTPEEKLEAYFQSYREILAFGDRICPGGILEAEFNDLTEGIQARLREMVSEILGWLAETLSAARSRSKVHFEGDPADQAVAIVATLQGGLQIARTFGPDRFDAIVRQLKRSLDMAGDF